MHWSFNKLKLATKINMLTLLTILLFTLFIFIIIIPMIREKLEEEKHAQLRNQVESIITMVNGYNTAILRGTIDADSAKKEAISRINNIRYDKDNYFWVNGPETFLVHPLKPELVGKGNSEVKDNKGKDFVTTLIREARSKGYSFQNYVWTKGDDNKLAPKISYSQYFEPWDWSISTGIYVDDIDSKISSVTQMIIISSIIIVALSILINFWAVRVITKPINLAISAMMNIAGGDVNNSSAVLDNYLKNTK